MTNDDQPKIDAAGAEAPFQFSLRQLLGVPLLLALLFGMATWQGFMGVILGAGLACFMYALLVPVPKDASFPFKRWYLLAVPIGIGLFFLTSGARGTLGGVWFMATSVTGAVLVIMGLCLRSKHWFCTGLGILVLWLMPALSAVREAGEETACHCQFKRIGLALHNYHDVHRCFPPAYVADEHGRPLYSWRVLILPFMESTPPTEVFNLDEPWDSPNNLQELRRRAIMFQCPSDTHIRFSGEPTTTSYLAVVGADTAWPAPESTSFDDIRDGSGNTIFVVEVHNSGVDWSEPRDLHVLQMAPTVNADAGQGISSSHSDGANVLMADGSVRFLPADSIPPELLRAMLTVAGGEQVDPF